MSKLQKQEREQIRIAIKKQYDAELQKLKESCRELESTKIENTKLRLENDELKAKIAAYDEWIERMQEYCNFSDEELDTLKQKAVVDKKVGELLGIIPTIRSGLGFRF